MRSCVMLNQSVTAISWPTRSLRASGESRVRLGINSKPTTEAPRHGELPEMPKLPKIAEIEDKLNNRYRTVQLFSVFPCLRGGCYFFVASSGRMLSVPDQYFLRNSFFRTLPVPVRGSVSRNSTVRGHL